MSKQEPPAIGTVIAEFGHTPTISYEIQSLLPSGEWMSWGGKDDPLRYAYEGPAIAAAKRLAAQLPARFRVVVVERR